MTEQRGPRSGRVDALPTLAGFRRDLLTSDLVAGLTVWAVLVPEALAYATIAGVSPVVGLYAAVPALVLYTVFGSSRHLVVGPMSATAAMSAATVADLAARSDASYVDLTVGVALVTGALAIAAGLLRLGFVASFISEPVLKGFIIGLALTIIVGQLPELFGVEGGGEDFFQRVWELIGHLGDTQAWTIGVGAASLAVVLGLRRLLPRLPGSLVAVVLGILAVSLFDLEAHGVEIVGPIESGLPTFGLPDLGLGDYGALVGPAVGILLVAFAEGLAAAKTFASKEHYSIDIDRELVGVGAANIGSGLSSGMVVSGSLSKTAVNGAAGARSQVSGLTVAALTVLTLLFLTGLFENLPQATLAAVVVAAVVDLVDVRALVRLWRIYSVGLGEIYGRVARADFIAAVATLLGVLVFDTLPGLFIGIALSAILLVYRSSRPHVAVLGREPGRRHWVELDRHPGATPVPGVLVVRPEAGLFYANADNVQAAIDDHLDDAVSVVVLDLAAAPNIDVTATDVLVTMAAELDRRGIRFGIAHDVGPVHELLVAAGAEELLDRMHRSVHEAVTSLTGDATDPDRPLED